MTTTSKSPSIAGSSHVGPSLTSSGKRMVSTIAAITALAIGQRRSPRTTSSPAGFDTAEPYRGIRPRYESVTRSALVGTGVRGRGCGPSAGLSVHRSEVVQFRVARDPLSEQRSLLVGRSEVDPAPDAGFQHLNGHVREPVEVEPLSREAAARRVERQLVGSEEVL
jgi:hypothetical protein